MFVQIQFCNSGSFFAYLVLQEMQFLVISHQIVHASVVRILICRGYREFFLVFFQISFFNQFLYVLCTHINFHKTGKFQSQEVFLGCMLISVRTVP